MYTMDQFLLILHDGADSPFFALSPEEMQGVVTRYGEWAQRMAEQGRLRGGHKLEDGTARQMVGSTVTDGPFPETKEVVGGVFVIAAANYEDAVEVARTCPHLEFGRIEVRRVDPV